MNRSPDGESVWRRHEVAISDPDEAGEDISRRYDSKAWGARRTALEFLYRFSRVGSDDLSLHKTRFDGHLEGPKLAGDEVIVSWNSRGRGVLDIGGADLRVEAGTPVLHPVGRDYLFDYEDFDQNLVRLSGSLLRSVAGERHGAPVLLRFDAGHEPDPAQLHRWWRAVDAAARAAQRPHEVNALRAQDLQREVAAAFLDAFPHRVEELAPGLSAGAAGDRLRRALEFLHTNAHRSIDTEDAAREAGLSVRGVQEAFRRELNASPTAVLRGIRLERVREHLQIADPAATTVTAVAQQWGFAHLGRFAGAYAERFGESPSTTLRRASARRSVARG